MSRAGAIRAGRAFVELFTEDSQFVRGLNNAKRQLQGFASFVTTSGRQLATAGGAVLAAFGGAVAMFAKTGDDLADMSARTGLAVEALGRLQFAAGQTGSEMTDVEAGVRVMQRSILDLSRDSASAVENFGALGLTFSELRALSPEGQFLLIADRIARIEDPTLRAAMAMKVFGRGGTALLPMLSQGAAGLEALGREAESLGLVMSGEQAQAASEFADLWGKITMQLKMAVVQIGGALAPELTGLSESLSKTIVRVIDWIKENSGAIVVVAKVAAAVTAAGVTLLAFGVTASSVAAIMGLTSTAVAALGVVIGALTTPIGLVVAAVAALGAGILYASGLFENAKSVIPAAWQGIVDAVKAGDLRLAMEIAFAAIEVAWLKTLDNMRAALLSFFNDSFGVGSIFEMAMDSAGVPAHVEEMMDGVFDIGLQAAMGGGPSQSTLDAEERLAQLREDAANAAEAAGQSPPGTPGMSPPVPGSDPGSGMLYDSTGRPDAYTTAPPEVRIIGFEELAEEIEPREALSAEGSFNAFQASAFGTGVSSTEERTARATEQTARATREIERQVRNGGGIVS